MPWPGRRERRKLNKIIREQRGTRGGGCLTWKRCDVKLVAIVENPLCFVVRSDDLDSKYSHQKNKKQQQTQSLIDSFATSSSDIKTQEKNGKYT